MVKVHSEIAQKNPNKKTRKGGLNIKSLDILGAKFNFVFASNSGKFQTALGG